MHRCITGSWRGRVGRSGTCLKYYQVIFRLPNCLAVLYITIVRQQITIIQSLIQFCLTIHYDFFINPFGYLFIKHIQFFKNKAIKYIEIILVLFHNIKDSYVYNIKDSLLFFAFSNDHHVTLNWPFTDFMTSNQHFHI